MDSIGYHSGDSAHVIGTSRGVISAAFAHGGPLAGSNHRLSIFSLLVVSSTILSSLPAFAQGGTDGTWIQIAPDPNGPIDRTEVCTVVDSRRDRLVLFGGYSVDQFLSRTYYSFPTETWALNLTGMPVWSRIAQPDLPPYGRAGAVAAYDSTTDRVWLLGGYHRTGDGYSVSPKRFDAGALLLDFGAGAQWAPVAFSGPSPAPREQASLVVDESRRRLLLFGGLDSNGVALADLWSMSLDGAPQWTLLSPSGTTPSARYRAAVVYDRSNDRLVLAAGIGDGGLAHSDLWELPLSGPLQWNALSATGAGPSGGVVGAEDRTMARMLVVARGDSTTHVWELSQEGAPAWRELAPGGMVPATSDFGFAAAYDPISTRMPLTWDPRISSLGSSGPPPVTFILQFAPPPVVHLTASLDSVVYSHGFSAFTWHFTADDTLFAPILFERQQSGGWLEVASAFLTPSGDMTLHENVLQPGQQYSYRMEWLSATAMQPTPVFDIDTPPPPTVLHVSPATLLWFDDNPTSRHDLFVQWSVPDDSAKWLAPIVIERREDGGVWSAVNSGFSPLLSTVENDPAIGHRYEFRLRWGPTLTEHTAGDTSFVIPPRPAFLGNPVAYSGHIEMDWSYPPDPNLVVTGYATYVPASFPDRTIPVAPPDSSGVLRLIDLTPLPSGATATYRLGWNVGTGERFTPFEVAYVGDSLGPPPPPPPASRFSMSPPWPQPASASLQLSLHLTGTDPARLSLYDLTGRLVREQTVVGSGDQILTLDLTGVRSGVYLIRATQGGVTTSRRAVIVR